MSNQVDNVSYITSLVIDMMMELESDPYSIPLGVSARHIHLSQNDLQALFGKGYELTFLKKLSQPGQFAAAETVEVIGPQNSIKKVRILGPVRAQTQVEVSASDGRKLGLTAPVRTSGDLNGTPGIKLKGPAGEITIACGVIVADRHIHMTPADAKWYGVMDGEKVQVLIEGPKSGSMGNVTIRVSDSYKLDLHVDVDDGNAFLLRQGQKLKLMKA
ncbi:MAG: phosphate propanoyltransferase [Lachnospiraceae bacterium]|nr:phosphate propanoyltransferase [Lachnospiraceae bacterium]